jgi:3',5'-nucleoside bisphosphate phosphatase
MARGQPFTQLCQHLASLNQPIVADLHMHSTASDGDYTPSQILALAQQAKLKCVAITDHDTFPIAVPASPLEVIPAVEFSSVWKGQEWHILGYFLDPSYTGLQTHLDKICQARRERFGLFVTAFREKGASLIDGMPELVVQKSRSLGRRHLMKLLIQAGLVRHRHEAFREWIGPAMETVQAIHLTPIVDIIRLIHDAGGIASLAHPPTEISADTLLELQKMGMDCVECRYPAAGKGTRSRLEQICQNLGLGITAGSDCHGSEIAGRLIGSHGLRPFELDQLRQLCGTSR